MKQNDNKFQQLLKKLISTDNIHTHTRIPNKNKNIFGGSYNISNDNDYNNFLKEYYNHIFIEKNKEYLTEKQNLENCPLVIDIDMRFNKTISERQYKESHILDFLNLYLDNLNKIYELEENLQIEIFIMEKPNINILENKIKDGIHIIFGINVDRPLQIYLREQILENLLNIWEDLDLINSKEEIIDEGITRGTVNWQLYGSQKPDNERYELKYIYNAILNLENNEWKFIKKKVQDFDLEKDFYKLTVRNSSFPKFPIKKTFEKDSEKIINEFTKKRKPKLNINNSKSMDILNINNIEELDEIVKEMLSKIESNTGDYELKETHLFTLLLPDCYYESGSYNKWIRVGWALKNTSTKLLPTWLKFCSQARDFTYNSIPELIERWNKFEYNSEGLTSRSIMYWAKNDNPKEYYKVRNETISYFIEQTITNVTEWDFAQVLYQICKDEFVCVSIKNNIWYEYINHRWFEIDSGNTLRLIISKRMHDIYMKKVTDAMNDLQKIDLSDDNHEGLRKRSNKLTDLCLLLKKTNWKNNIMREAKELFYDKDFYNKLDNNPNLLCFNNFVVDFKNNIIRNGQPDDYISKCTNIDYIPYKYLCESYQNIIDEINLFIEQLFPNKELRDYMWSHLASTLIGNNDNQTFNIYTGSGANGKSKLVDLMSKVLGDYKATVPITLVTQKRTNIGSTSSEIVQLMGVRYAVMQEPSKGDKINEGIMKEITGGDPIQGRALFKEAITFIPQFKLVVCTNTLFDIKSNDDGTWRRIRVNDFMSKFLEKPYEDEIKFPKSEYPYQYPIDKHIDAKFEKWAPVLASMLVEITFRNKGIVKDSNIVLASSDQYREGQDYLAEFIKEKIKSVKGGKIKKTELWEVFKQWFTINYGKGLPKAREVNEYMDKRYGKYVNKWNNVVINYDDEDEDDE